MRIEQIGLVCVLACSAVSTAQIANRVSGAEMKLRYARFDPLATLPNVPPALRADADVNLWIVQAASAPTERLRESIRATGGRVHGYLPDNAYVVRMDAVAAVEVHRLSGVRWVGYYEPAYRLEPYLIAEIRDGVFAPSRHYHCVVADKHADKPSLAAKVEEFGGEVVSWHNGSLLFDVEIDGAGLMRLARCDEVLWVDRAGQPELDLNNARIQGGADYVEAQGGYSGQGVNVHVYEGIEATHYDFTSTPINVQSCGTASAHGHATAGVVFGNGMSHPNARGIAPDAQGFYTTFTCVTPGVTRWQVVRDLVNVHEVMLTTASWGNSRTQFYNSISAATDEIIFDHDIPWTQSHGNTPQVVGRPEAWAKNVFTIGAVVHNDNPDPSDDSWGAGGAAIGPSSDGRIKPDFVGYWDDVWTSDLIGAAGFSPADHWPNFGGTSAAAPMVGGFSALAIQMFTDGLFSAQRVAGGSRFQNRPHAATLKALMIANARQYPFSPANMDNSRAHVGWGFPDLKTMLDNAGSMLVIDETDVLTQGQSMSYTIPVTGNEPELKIAMVHADVPSNPGAATHRVNNLDLRVTRPDGTVYFGNAGLPNGNYSTSGGGPDNIDTVECVFVQNPMAGNWTVEVSATLVAEDGHVETIGIDADYGLCVSFGVREGALTGFGQGCVGSGLGGGPVVPRFELRGPAETGLTVRGRITDTVPLTSAVLVTGFSNTMALGVPLPIALDVVGAPGCALLVRPDISAPLTSNPAGEITGIDTRIGADPTLIGLAFYQQALILDPAANALGVVTTGGWEIIVGG